MDRSAIMRAVKGRDTAPELLVRKILRAFAPGYRLCRRDFPGAPDVAYIGRKKAICVHGCFWHGHDCKRGARAPKANAEYWQAKIAKNRARDAKHLAEYAAMGWDVLIVWECETRERTALEARLREYLKTGSSASERDRNL